MYTLVSAAVLAADVVRHPHTVTLADTLDRVLALTEDEVAALGTPAHEGVRARVLRACSATPRVGGLIATVADELRTDGATAGLATRLEGALLGSLEDVHALLLRERPLRDLTPEAQQVVLDAVSAAWAGPGAAVADARALAAAFHEALDPVPRPLPERPWTPALRSLLDEVPRRTTPQWRASVARHRSGRSLRWSDGLHVACRAAWEADRVADVARAQLAAARALALTHTGVPPYGAALVLTAAVQVECTRDLIAPSVAEGLRAAWEAGGSRSIG